MEYPIPFTPSVSTVKGEETFEFLKAIPSMLSALVAVAALPVVFWLPVVFTPGKLMFALPLNETPPIVRAVCRTVAVAALPEVFWLPAVLTPGRSMLAVPLNETPPMFLAVCKAVAVAALPVVEPDVVAEVAVEALPFKAAVIVPAEKLPEASRATMALAVFALVAVVAEFGTLVNPAPDPVNCVVAVMVVPRTVEAVVAPTVAPSIAPPVIDTLLAFCVDIVPKPVMAVLGMVVDAVMVLVPLPNT